MRTDRILSLFTGAALTALSLLGVGCGNDVDGVNAEQSALVGGQTTSARPEVGLLQLPGKNCTATMISQRTFVSAADCVNYAWHQTGGVLTLGVGSFNVQQMFTQGNTPADSFIYGRITSPAAVTPATIATSEAGAGWMTAMGFGCFDHTCTATEPKNFVQYWYNGSTPSYINTPVDEGGPVFMGLLSDNGPLIRIASGVLIVVGTGHTSDYGADAFHYRPYIQAMDTALNADGISYRSSVQSNGWMQAVQNGGLSGTMGQSLRLEALQVWSPRPGVSVCYSGYVQGVGWQPEQCDGNMVGTVGQSLRMEAVKIRLASKPAGTNGVMYNTYLQGIGWQGWMKDNIIAGTTGQSRRIEAIEIALY